MAYATCIPYGATSIPCPFNSENTDFRFAVIRHYYANFRMHITSVPALTERRTTQDVLMSPRRGQHDQERMSAVDAPNGDKRLRCRQCRAKTGYKCTKCSTSTSAVALFQFKQNSERQCWNEWHSQREYDLRNSQSYGENVSSQSQNSI